MTSDEKAAWLAERCGWLTASNMKRATAFLRNGDSAKERIDLMYEILAERQTGFNARHVVTDAMQWGLDHEDEAVDRFVEMTGRDVRLSRFYKHLETHGPGRGIEYFGATPDRELDDGILEVKCPTTAKFLRWRVAGTVPDEHRPQILAQLACTGRKWCGFIAYDPRVKEPRQQLFLAKLTPTPEEIWALENAAKEFLSEVDELWERLNS